MNKLPLIPMLLIMLLGTASAGTVSLTGTCQSNLMSGNILNFTLVNSGNDTAYNLQLSPVLSGAQAENLSYPLGSLPSDQGATFLIPLTNITVKGTFIDALVATYQQGSNVFTALFPCTVNMGKSTVSAVFLSVNTFSSSGTSIMNVSALNSINTNLTVNVSALFPPSFSFITKPSYLLHLGPYGTQKVQFVVNYPTTQASYTGAIVDHYVYKNSSYASFAPIVVSQSPPSASTGISPFLIGSIIVGIAIVLLIARSISKNKKKHDANPKGSA
ncbi:MAG: hypothetical protein KGH65_04095 [Candidatus Micrarchaeota archaeon]|nr:hypothetical protein [Candidatus Micrarchaeota archaeon]